MSASHDSPLASPAEASARLDRRATPLSERLRRHADDEKGGVSVMFALIIVALCLFVGAAVDFGRWAQARHQTIAAMDAAVLAGGRMMQLNEPVESAREAALRYYIQNTQGRTPVVDDTITFDAVDDNTAFAAMGNAYIETAFLSFARIDKLPLLDLSKATYSKAEVHTGGYNDDPVEISVMLDVTGSMAGSKIRDLQAAAADLVDIVISDHPLAKPVRIALVPFAEGVRLPQSAWAAARGTPATSISVTTGSGKNRTTTEYYPTECVVERTGTNRYTDVAPGRNNYVMTLFNRAGSGGRTGRCGVTAKSEVVPLTGNKTVLKNRISDLELSVYTAGHLGTAWAWYTLSPNWNALWPNSAASSYDSGVQKIAILMTDGEYNEQYNSQGLATRTSGAGSAANGTSTAQARALCTAMKARDITVYTVGFALGRNSEAIQTLDHCATDPTMAYVADNGAQLREAFRDIALKISSLHLTQ